MTEKTDTVEKLKKEIVDLRRKVSELELRTGSLTQRNMLLEARMKFIVAYHPELPLEKSL